MKEYYYLFTIAEVHICLKSMFPMKMSDSFSKFAEKGFWDTSYGYTVEFREVSALDTPKGTEVYQESPTSVYLSSDGTFYRLFGKYGAKKSAGEKRAYAAGYYDWENRSIRIEYLPAGRDRFDNIQTAFRHIAWESVLMHERRVLLHASFVETPYGGIAFSGPSGIGKSTQGDLWQKYGRAKLINGDKLTLCKKPEGWIGYGSPFAGSSGCYLNERCGLDHLFFLKQGKECSLKRLTASEGFIKIYSGLTVNRWNRDYVQAVCDMAQQLAMEVPVYEFTCTPDEKAVYFLQERLREGGNCDAAE